MEPNHRQKILKNIEKLRALTDYDALMDACIKYELLFDVMKENIEKSEQNNRKRHEKLLKKITHRGPTAYKLFLDILKHQFHEAYEVLTHQSYYNPLDDPCVSIRDRLNQNGINRQESREPLPSPPAITIQPPFETEDPPTCSSSNEINVSRRSQSNIVLKEFTDVLIPKLNIDVKKSTRIHGDEASKVGTYSMHSKNRGILVFVNIIDFYKSKDSKRSGAEVDRNNFITLFRQMGFKIYYYENLQYMGFWDLITKLTSWPGIEKFDSFVLAVFSHGDRSETGFTVQFSDGMSIDIEHVLERFNNQNCHYLVNKPKIFFFPFCRGKKIDIGCLENGSDEIQTEHVFTATDSIQLSKTIPTFYDMKICFATVPGYYAYRDKEHGSWYVSVLCTVFAQSAHDCHLEELLKMVGNHLSEQRSEKHEMQTSSNEDRGFNKTLYFNPGYYE